MDGTMFDALTRTAGSRQGRRNLIRALGSAALAIPILGGATPTETGAKRRKVRGEHNRRAGGKKTVMCYEGETVRVPTKRRKKWLRQGATRGKCDGSCTPVCPAGSCQVDDGCGGFCGCDAGSICVAGVCEVCNVTCAGTPEACGEALDAAMDAGGKLYVCPGEYRHAYAPALAVAVFGAGNGDDPATSTILSWNPSFVNQPVVSFSFAVTSSLTNLRVTGGTNGLGAGGIFVGNATANVTLQDCVVADNNGGNAGGVHVSAGNLIVDGCEITGNTAIVTGGGLLAVGNMTITNTTISGNTALNGGGLFISGGTTTLASTVTITGNTASGIGGGIWQVGGTLNLDGASVTGNIPSDCVGAGC